MNPTLLRAFRHPLILSSIALLAVNDHLLKHAAPSWMTGKLSDFAGLFFFPFLLGAAFQMCGCICGRMCSRAFLFTSIFGKSLRLRATCFFLTGLVFTGVKTIPLVNAAMTALFPYPAQIIRDPGDLLALIVFLPAWSLWGSIERQQEHSPSKPAGKWAYLALGAASLASLATSPCPVPVAVIRLAEINETLYAGVTPVYGQASYSKDNLGVYSSANQGLSWDTLQEIPDAVREALATPVNLPKTVCEPQNPRVCYRISDASQVEVSNDAGKTWQVSWQIPQGRSAYMDRAAGNGAFLACTKTPDRHPYDMLFISEENGPVLVIAWGNEGILRKEPSGIWERIAVSGAGIGSKTAPTPMYASDLWTAMTTTGPEFWSSLLLAILAYLGISTWAWILAARRSRGAGCALWQILLPLLSVLFFLALWTASKILSRTIGNALENYALLAALLTPIALFVSAFIWYRSGAFAAYPARYRLLSLTALGASFMLFLIVWLPFILWAFGTIPMYATALTLAVILGLGLLVGCLILIRRWLNLALAA